MNNVDSLLDRLAGKGLPKPGAPGPGVRRALVVGPVEVAASTGADESYLRARWRERVGNAPQPYLLLADDPEGPPGRVRVLGPSRPDAAVQVVDGGLLERALERTATEPKALTAVRGLSDELARLGGEGLTCRGLLTRHTVERRLRADGPRWQRALELCRGIRPDATWREVIEGLGFQVDTLPARGYLARHEGAPVAVVHPKQKVRDLTRMGGDGRLPEGQLLRDCTNQGARYGFLVADGRFRLFDSESSSAASEWFELDLRLLGEERLGFMALVSPEYLAAGGLSELRAEASRFGSRLHDRLDRTVRLQVLPVLAADMGRWAGRAGIDVADDGKREELEQAALTLVFRLLFVLYCESAGYLPRQNRAYEVRSLSRLVQEAADTAASLSPRSFALWRDFGNLVHALRVGNPAWDVPAYNGALFGADDLRGAELLEEMELPDPVFGQVLVALGRDPETGHGTDFSTLEIAHLGHIYESLLSLRLTEAKQSLRYEETKDRYVPASPGGDTPAAVGESPGTVVRAGDLLWQTHEGGRKAGGVYYTPVDIVRHLVERSVLPAFERHLEQVRELARTDTTGAARLLLSFAVVDPACGSAHFLVQVADTLAERTVAFLAEHHLPLIAQELEALRAGATRLASLEDVSLLRRLLVKHCVFGVDVSPMGAEVAKLSLWLATFVPGLSLAHLGRNVVVGNSLIGVADAERLTAGLSLPLFARRIRDELDEARRRVRRLFEIQDRTPEEVKKSQREDREVEQATAGVRRAFDLWTAEQFGLEGARNLVEVSGADLVAGSGWGRSELVPKAGHLAFRHGFLHWPLTFPQVFSRERPGFDVVVGNPPWEEVTVEELSFYGLYRPGLNAMREADRARVIADMVDERPELPALFEERKAALEEAREALKAGDYGPMAGDSDLYKYFCARYRDLVREGGFIGVVLPRTAFNTKGSKGISRSGCMVKSRTHRVDFLLNTGRWMPSTTEPQVLHRTSRGRAPSNRMRGATGLRSRAPRPVRLSGSQQSADVRASACRRRCVRSPDWETPLLRSQDRKRTCSGETAPRQSLPVRLRRPVAVFPRRGASRDPPQAVLVGADRGVGLSGRARASISTSRPEASERVCQARAVVKGKLSGP